MSILPSQQLSATRLILLDDLVSDLLTDTQQDLDTPDADLLSTSGAKSKMQGLLEVMVLQSYRTLRSGPARKAWDSYKKKESVQRQQHHSWIKALTQKAFQRERGGTLLEVLGFNNTIAQRLTIDPGLSTGSGLSSPWQMLDALKLRPGGEFCVSKEQQTKLCIEVDELNEEWVAKTGHRPLSYENARTMVEIKTGMALAQSGSVKPSDTLMKGLNRQ